MVTEVPSLTDTLNFFEHAFEGGRTVLGPNAKRLFTTLVTFEVVFSGLYIALGESTGIKTLARKLLFIGFLYWVIENYTDVLHAVLQGFLDAGQQAVGVNGIDLATLQSPDKIFQHGLIAAKPAVDKLFSEQQNSTFGIPSIDMILMALCLTASVLSYGLIAVQIFITYLEFLLISAVGFILIPFGIFKPTAWLSERVFGAIVMFGIKLMVLALVVGMSDVFVSTLSLPETVSWQQMFEFLIVSLALAFLSFHAPGIAVSLFTGAPQFSITSGAVSAIAANSLIHNQARNQSSVVAAAANAGARTLGSMYGSSRPEISQGATGSRTSGTSSSSGLSKVARIAAGATAGALAAPFNSAKENLLYGSDSPSSPTARHIRQRGDNPLEKGLRGSFNRGKFSIQKFRDFDSKIPLPSTKPEAKEQTANDPTDGNKQSSKDGESK